MPELLMAPLEDLRLKWNILWSDAAFRTSFFNELTEYAGRPTPLTEVPHFAHHCGSIRVFL